MAPSLTCIKGTMRWPRREKIRKTISCNKSNQDGKFYFWTSSLLCFGSNISWDYNDSYLFWKKDGFFLSFPFLNKKRKERPHLFMVCNLNIHCKELQVTHEQHGSQLQGSTYTRIFVSSKHYITTQSTVGWIWGCRGTKDMEGWYKLYVD